MTQTTRTPVEATRQVRYDVIHETDAFHPDGALRRALAAASQPVLVVDRAVRTAHADRLTTFLAMLAKDTVLVTLPGGEANKSLAAAMEVIAALDRAAVPRRSSPIVAIGGGVVCDVVGFAASMYRRGIPYIRVPTTLLSQVDVSVAIKTGVNNDGFRNRLGAFWPPQATIVDRSLLLTQPSSAISQGLAEIFKLGLITSAGIFERLEALPMDWTPAWYASAPEGQQIIEESIAVMASELRSNLWEEQLRRCVDFGHSFSPLIEMATGLHHGYAVALDCLLTTCIAVNRNLAPTQVLRRTVAAMRRCRLPLSHEAFADAPRLWASLCETVRHRDGRQHLPIPTAVGTHTFIEDLTESELRPAISLMSAATRPSQAVP